MTDSFDHEVVSRLALNQRVLGDALALAQAHPEWGGLVAVEGNETREDDDLVIAFAPASPSPDPDVAESDREEALLTVEAPLSWWRSQDVIDYTVEEVPSIPEAPAYLHVESDPVSVEDLEAAHAKALADLGATVPAPPQE